MKKWLIVHSEDSFKTNSTVIGFDYEKAKQINPQDCIIYYLKGIGIKGLYEVTEKPWAKENMWSAKYQIEIVPRITLQQPFSINEIKHSLEFCANHQNNWGTLLQGPNNIRELSEQDFVIINNKIEEFNFQEAVKQSSKDDEKTRKKRLSSANKIPKKILSKVIRYKRNPDVVATVLNRANGICEICGKKAPFLKAKDNSPYLEVHHKIQLSQGGEDIVENAIAVCPNCHRKLHFG